MFYNKIQIAICIDFYKKMYRIIISCCVSQVFNNYDDNYKNMINTDDICSM